MEHSQRRWRPPLPYLLVTALYVLPFPYHPGLHSPNELCRLWQARAITEYGTLELNQTLREYGYVGDLAVMDGRYYPSKAPLLSLAAVPVYAVLRVIGGSFKYSVPELPLVYWSRFFLTVLPTLGMLFLIRSFLKAYVSERVADAVTITYALGSLAFSYSLLFMSHQTTAVLLFAAFFALWRCGRGEWRERGYGVAGAAAGAAVAAEYTGALAVLALVLYAVLLKLRVPSGPMKQRLIALGRAAGLAALGAAPFVLGLMWYHTVCFGGPLESGYKHLADPGYQPWHLGGFMGIRFPDPRAFSLSFFSPLRGLFTLAPFLLIALPGLVAQGRSSRKETPERALFWLSASMLLGYAYFTSSFSYESWGWTTGARHMTGLVPFLLLPTALAIESLRRASSVTARVALGLCAGLCAGSIVVTGVLTFVNYVPDSVSNAFFGFALPLFSQGLLPPSVLGILIPNPVSGILLLIVLGITAALVFASLSRSESQPRPSLPITALVGVLSFTVYFGILWGSTEYGDRDRAAQGHLRSVWVMQPGTTLTFWR